MQKDPSFHRWQAEAGLRDASPGVSLSPSPSVSPTRSHHHQPSTPGGALARRALYTPREHATAALSRSSPRPMQADPSQLQEELALAKHELALSEKLRLALQSQLRDSPKAMRSPQKLSPQVDARFPLMTLHDVQTLAEQALLMMKERRLASNSTPSPGHAKQGVAPSATFITKLNTRVYNLEQQLEAARLRLKESENENEALKSELSVVHIGAHGSSQPDQNLLQEQVWDLTQQVASLERQLEQEVDRITRESDAKCAQLARDRDAARTELKRLDNHLDLAHTPQNGQMTTRSVRRLESDLEGALRDVELLQQRVRTMAFNHQDEIQRLTRQLDQASYREDPNQQGRDARDRCLAVSNPEAGHSQHAALLKQRLEQSETEIAELEAANMELKEQLTLADRRVVRLSEQKEQIETMYDRQVSSAGQPGEAIRFQVGDLTRQVHEMEEQCRVERSRRMAEQGRMNELENQNVARSSHLDELQNDFSVLQRGHACAIQKLESELTQKELEKNDALALCAAAEQAASNRDAMYNSKIRDLEKRNQELEAQWNDTQSTMTCLISEMDSQTHQSEMMKAHVATLEKQLELTHHSLSTMEEQFSGNNRELDVAVSERDKARSDAAILAKNHYLEMNKLRARVQEVEREKELVRANLIQRTDELEAQLAAAHTSMSAMESDFSKMSKVHGAIAKQLQHWTEPTQGAP
mmetsp:Transcript_38547/g.73838  ORF Transcript_38547/g.73838 Transcript_38547/m.73838 type:complete len:700 (+) Transcript_38547:149-2248(+)